MAPARRECMSGCPLEFLSSARSEVLVPLDIVRGAADHDDVQPAVAIDVNDLASGRRHAHRIEDLVMPLRALVILRIKNMRARNLGLGAVSGYDVAAAVPV